MTGALLLVAALFGGAPSDPVLAEADRLVARAAARGARPGGAVDLMRLEALTPWLPRGYVATRLRAAAEDPARDPLVRAVGWWLLRDLALLRMDSEAATAAAAALGLLDAFVMRAGPAPHPTATLSPAEWRPYPRGMGAGTLWLGSVLRPNRDTVATVATRLVSPEGGPAIIRLGYDDQATVWLNGDEVYAAPAPHPHWLDQAAIPVTLRPGDNRLVIAIRQRAGAWRLTARVTDGAGVPSPVTAHPDPWGAPPDPAEGEPPEAVAHLWPALSAAADAEPPEAQALRDLADYARRTGLPDPDQSTPRVAIEGAWADDPSPRSLRAWLEILPAAERPMVRSQRAPTRPIRFADHFADLMLALAEGWDHFYSRRHQETRRVVEALAAQAPTFLPALRLRVVMLEDLGLVHSAAALVEAARRRFPERPALERAWVTSLRTAERVDEARDALEALVAAKAARTDDLFQLATMHATRGETDRALALLDGVVARRPELVSFALEAATLAWRAGRAEAALTRLEALARQVPGDPAVALLLAEVLGAGGQRAAAVAILEAARATSPDDEEIAEALVRLTVATPVERLGPAVAALSAIESPAGPAAHVLYHHARAEVGASGEAVRRLRRVVRILTDEGGRRFAEWELPYVPSTQRLVLEEARLLRAGAPPITPSRGDRDLSEPEYRLYYDLRAEVLSFPPPRPGDVIEVAWRLEDTDPDPAFPGYFGEVAYLQEVAPRAWSVVEVTGPAAPRLALEVVPRGIRFTREGGRVEARDVPGVPLEAGMPGASSVRAYVHMSTLEGWDEADRLYRDLLADRNRATAELEALARRWGGEGDERTILGRLYAAVAQRTRYVGLEFGVRSFRPARPAVTLARGYGDCKDKAALLVSLARARGIDAHLTLVRTRPAGIIAAKPASFAVFDHAMVYAPSVDRFLDPTVDRNDPWTLPPGDQGATAFVVGVDTALRTVPAAPAAENVEAWRLDGSLSPDGAARGTLTWTTRGQPATEARRGLEAEGARRRLFEEAIGHLLPGAAVEPTGFDGLEPAFDPVEARGRVTLPARPTGNGLRIPVGGGDWGVVRRYAQAARRRTPLILSYRMRNTVSLRLALPPGYGAELPPPVELRSPFGRLTAQAALEGGVLRLEADLHLEVIEVSPADYRAFRAWLAEVDRALTTPVEVRR